MKAIKTLLAASALATVAGAANATVWNISLTENTFFGGAGGPLIINWAGTYDDAAAGISGFTSGPGLADVSGHVSIPGYGTEIDYSHVYIDISGVDGYGWLNQPDSAASNCTANTTTGCGGFSQALQGNLYNGVQFAISTDKKGNQSDQSTGTPFTAAAGTYTWTAVLAVPEGGKSKVYQLPFTVTLTAPEVPVPAAAWLFGSGLLGLAGTARRRRSA
jgi:hypothetical protein